MAFFSKKQTNNPLRRQSVASEQRPTGNDLNQRYAFKRNRTLTGSASSHVISTGESKAQIKSPRVQAHHLVWQRRHISGLLLLTILGCIALVALITQFTADVRVKTDDNSVVLDDTYEKAIQQYLSQQPAERLRFLLNEDHLRDFLQVTTPEIKTINIVESAGFGVTAFQVTMRTPIAGWSIKGKQQYVDSTGVSFARNYYSPPPVQIVDNSDIQVATGQAIASNSFIGFVGQVVGLAKTYGYVTMQVIIPSGTTRQIELRLKDTAYPVKFSVDRPAGEQVEDMAASVEWMKRHNLSPQYVDVRISGRAFYR